MQTIIMFFIQPVCKFKFKLLFIPVIFILLSCSKAPVEVTQALENANMNRRELEKVIKHYKHRKKDKLKLKATYFLIENMLYHYSITGEDYDNLMEMYKIVNDKPVWERDSVFDKLIDSLQINYQYNYYFDLSRLNARYLIESIDAAFEI